jgi:PAS domain S-box-containing protein
MPFSPPTRALSALIGGLLVATFAVDLLVPLGYAVPLLYGIPLVLTLWHPSRRATLLVYGVAFILTAAGFFKSPAGMVIPHALVNRTMIVGAGLLLTWLLLCQKDAGQGLQLTQHAVDGAADAVFFADADKRFIYVNREACRSLGYTEAELRTLRVSDIHPGHDHARFAARLPRLARGEVERYESIHRTKDGRDFPVEITLSALWHEGRRVTCVIARDITAQKQDEETLRLAKFALNYSSEGMFVVGPDARILAANETACRRLEYGREELLSLSIADIDPDYSLERWPAHWQEIKRLGRLVIETTNRTKSGRIFPVEVSIAYLPWASRECCCSIITDITARKEAEAALRRAHAELEETVAERTAELRASEARFREVTEHIQEVFWLSDTAKSEVLYFSPGYEAIWGRSCESLRASPRSWLEGIHPEDRERIWQAALTRQMTGTYDEEYRIVRPDGRVRWVRDRAFPIRDEAGAVVRLAGIAGDITARKEAEQALARLNATLEQRIAERTTALRESEARFRAIFEQAAVGVAVIDTTTGRFVRVNRKHAEIVGLTIEQMTASTFMAITHPDDLGADLDQMEALKAGQIRTFTMDKRYIKPDGSRVWVTLTVSPMWPVGAAPDFHIAVVEDITARKQAEADLQRSHEELRRSEAQVRAIVDHLPLMVFMKEAKELRFARFNRAAEALVGLTESEVLGKSDYDFFPKDQADFFTAKDREVLESGRALDIPEDPIQTRDRGLRYLHTKKFPLLDGQGRPEFLVGISEDVTERKAMEEALRESEDRFRSAFELSPIGMALATRDGVLVRVNKRLCEFLGYAESELIGMGLGEITHPDDRAAGAQGADAVSSGRLSMWLDERRYLHKNGQEVRALLTLSAIRDEAGHPRFILAQVQDVTELRRTTAELRRAEDLATERARFQALVSVLPDLAFVIDGEGRYLEVLTEDESGLYVPKAQIIGRTFHEIFPPAQADRFMNFIRATIETGRGQTIRYALSMPDGEKWYEAKSGPPLREGEGMAPRIFTVVREITERIRTQALEERERIGRDLHDGILQSLYATGLSLESSQELLDARPREGRRLLNDVIAQLNGVMREVRQFIGGLDAGGPQADDWGTAARVLIQSHSARYHVAAEVAIDSKAVRALTPESRLAFLNILREALSNSLRHARPRALRVELRRGPAGIRLSVKDDGRGFHPTAVGAGGHGLRNMKARADGVGARFEIVSELGIGTEVVVELNTEEARSHVKSG